MADTACPYRVGRRYLHVASGLPVTVSWLGVEWDNAARGKHSGSYKGQQIFTTRVPGAGSFIKYSPETSSATPLLNIGPSFIGIINERYAQAETQCSRGETETVVLGSSNGNIIVEAPRLDKVRQRLTKLENLKEAALEGLWISEVGQEDLQGRLSSLTRLNLSQNLLADWEEVGQIVAHTPALTALVLNQSRLARGTQQVDLSTISQLHLGNTLTAWEELPWLSSSLPNLTTLHLNSCGYLGKLEPLPECFASLQMLNLESTPLGGWLDIVTGLGALPNLRDLDLSSVDFDKIPHPDEEQSAFPALSHLSILESSVKSWSDIDALEAWTSKRLESLRISVTSPSPESASMKGDLSDRPILIAKLSHLKSLNSSQVSSAERTDSERFYVSYVSRTIAENPSTTASDWGRFEELCKVHGNPMASLPITSKKITLASKLITVHIHSGHGASQSLQLLPSTPLRLAKRKVAKALSLPASASFHCWTVQNGDEISLGEDVNTGVEMDEDGREIGWWLQDGDYLHVNF